MKSWKELVKSILILSLVVFGALSIIATGGGGDGSSYSNLKITTTLVQPSSDINPRIKFKGLSRNKENIQTVITGATVTLTTPDGTQYTMTETNNGNYEVTVDNFKNNNGFIIEAHKGQLELSKVIPVAVIVGKTDLYNAGEINVLTTAITEIIKEVAISISTTLDLQGVNLNVGKNLIENLDKIKAKVDIIELQSEAESGNNQEYTQIITSISATLQNADQNITGESAINQINRDAVFHSIRSGALTYPEYSDDKVAVRMVMQNLLDAYLAYDISSASSCLGENTLWTGADKIELLQNFQIEWQEEKNRGISKSFNGTIISKKINDNQYLVGLKGYWSSKDINGVEIEYTYEDFSEMENYGTYVEKTDGIWLVVGDKCNYEINLRYIGSIDYGQSDVSSTNPSNWEGVSLFVWQNFNKSNLINSVFVSGGIFGTSPVDVPKIEDESDGYAWDIFQNVDISPSTNEIYDIYINFKDGRKVHETTTINPYTPISEIDTMKLNYFLVEQDGFSVSWSGPDLPVHLSELEVFVNESDSFSQIFERELPLNTSAISEASAIALTKGKRYFINILYSDMYENHYLIQKYFVFNDIKPKFVYENSNVTVYSIPFSIGDSRMEEVLAEEAIINLADFLLHNTVGYSMSWAVGYLGIVSSILNFIHEYVDPVRIAPLSENIEVESSLANTYQSINDNDMLSVIVFMDFAGVGKVDPLNYSSDFILRLTNRWGIGFKDENNNYISRTLLTENEIHDYLIADFDNDSIADTSYILIPKFNFSYSYVKKYNKNAIINEIFVDAYVRYGHGTHSQNTIFYFE